ncbi:MAG: hypothetical protein AB2A00_11670 [Myxococcota bacterium]
MVRLGVVATALLIFSACPSTFRDPCLEEVHPEWHACYNKSGCDTARADADGGPARGDGGTEIVCGCCDTP